MVYFFTYGDHNYTNTKERLRQEAIDFGLFDQIDIYSREHLPEDFIEKTKPYIDMPRGGGYWLWKSYLIKKTFDKMNEGDFCVYVDAGCSLNNEGRETFKHYLELLTNDDSGIMRFVYKNTPEELFTTEKVFQYFGKENDTEFRNSDILMNGILVFKKCKNSIDYVEKYYQINLEDPDIFSDEYNYMRCEKFMDHRHDQSVSSCFVKLHGKFISIEDSSFENDMDGWRRIIYEKKFPFLATRIRG
jgi:hypothetical protein